MLAPFSGFEARKSVNVRDQKESCTTHGRPRSTPPRPADSGSASYFSSASMMRLNVSDGRITAFALSSSGQ